MGCRSEYPTALEANDAQYEIEVSDKSSVKVGTFSEVETASLYNKSENQLPQFNGYSDNRSPATMNGQPNTRAGPDTCVPANEAPNSGIEFGPIPHEKSPREITMLSEECKNLAGDYTKGLLKQALPSPRAADLQGEANISCGGYKPAIKFSDATNPLIDTTPNSLVDTLTVAIFGTINLLLTNHASAEELRESIRRELSACLHPNSQRIFKAEVYNENGSMNSQPKSIVCSTCKQGMKRPCDLK